jgi:long-chain acyl-CoA synthetase
MISGVPTMFAYLNDLPLSTISKYKLTSLTSCVSAGSILSPKIYNEFHDIYGARIADCYGITEAAGNLSANYRYGMVKPASAGTAYPFTDIKIVDDNDNPVEIGDVGELIARGPQIMKEYWRMPKETVETLKGGYLHTGDLARLDEDGYIHIVDRKKDLIITGGFNIYPAEVEILVNTYFKVSQSAMFGVSDETKGEIGWAAVVLKEGMSATEEEIIEYCRSQMAAYKCPRKVVFRECLPVNAMNKVLRRKLREEYSATGVSPVAKR